jgi:hypothetical protein
MVTGLNGSFKECELFSYLEYELKVSIYTKETYEEFGSKML